MCILVSAYIRIPCIKGSYSILMFLCPLLTWSYASLFTLVKYRWVFLIDTVCIYSILPVYLRCVFIVFLVVNRVSVLTCHPVIIFYTTQVLWNWKGYLHWWFPKKWPAYLLLSYSFNKLMINLWLAFCARQVFS